MDDYYKLLGVDPDAGTDEIKTAYRERKESGSGNAAKLNKAWNVLSDPYQRGRYDEQRAQAEEEGELDLTDPEPELVPARNGKRPTRGEQAREARRTRQMQAPTIEPPAGTSFPKPKQRIIAMVIDLVVLMLVLVGCQFGAQAVAKNQNPQAVDAANAYQKQIDNLNKQLDAAKSKVNDDKKANNSAQQATDQKTVDNLNQQIKDITKKRDDQYSKLNPYFLGGVVLTFVIALLYLAIPSALSGKTLGKRFQHLRALRQDGSPLGWAGAFARYGLIIGATLLLYLVFRELGAVIVLFGVTMWMRNPNQQGLHDRFAKTIVVSDAA